MKEIKSIWIMLVVICIMLVVFIVAISNLQSKVVDQQQIIEELAEHTGYRMVSIVLTPWDNIWLAGRLRDLGLTVDDHAQIIEELVRYTGYNVNTQ